GGAVHIESEVIVVVQRRLAGVESHAHAEVHSVGPGVIRERALRGDRRRCCLVRLAEDDEELVSAAVDLVPASLGDSGTEQAPVVVEYSLIAVAELMDETRRSFDVGKQQRDRSIGKL